MTVTKLYELLQLDDSSLSELARSYPNPPCWERCDRTDHDRAEWVRNGGELFCQREVASGRAWSVYVEVFHTVAAPAGAMEVEVLLGHEQRPPQLGVMWDLGDTIPLDEVAPFAAAVAAAAALCEELRQAAVDELAGGGVLDAIAAAERDALLAHRGGRCDESPWSCSHCETEGRA